jgi:hypothetical protein
MKEIENIENRREQLLEEIRNIRVMRKGSVTKQYFKTKKKEQEEPVLHGPYWLYSRKEKGKTVGQRLSQPEAERFQTEVDAFHHFKKLCDEYAEVTERLGDLERESLEDSHQKKRRKLRSKKKRK